MHQPDALSGRFQASKQLQMLGHLAKQGLSRYSKTPQHSIYRDQCFWLPADVQICDHFLMIQPISIVVPVHPERVLTKHQWSCRNSQVFQRCHCMFVWILLEIQLQQLRQSSLPQKGRRIVLKNGSFKVCFYCFEVGDQDINWNITYRFLFTVWSTLEHVFKTNIRESDEAWHSKKKLRWTPQNNKCSHLFLRSNETLDSPIDSKRSSLCCLCLRFTFRLLLILSRHLQKCICSRLVGEEAEGGMDQKGLCCISKWGPPSNV